MMREFQVTWPYTGQIIVLAVEGVLESRTERAR